MIKKSVLYSIREQFRKFVSAKSYLQIVPAFIYRFYFFRKGKFEGGYNLLVLGIESSCDETAAAVVQSGKLLSNVIASQFKEIIPNSAAWFRRLRRANIWKPSFSLFRRRWKMPVLLCEIQGIAVPRPGTYRVAF
jgi:hypothetical protein